MGPFVHTHLRIRGYYCRHGYPHGGPCPMVPTLAERLRLHAALDRVPPLWHLLWAGFHRARIWFPVGWDRYRR